LSSRSPPPDFPPFRHRAVSSSFSTKLPLPFPFPLAPPSRCITIMSRSRAPTRPRSSMSRACPLFFSHILFKSILFLSSNFFPRLFFLRWLPLSFSLLCCLLPARTVARSLRARAGQRTTRRCPRCWLCTRNRITPPPSRHGRRGRCYSLCRCVLAARARQAGVRSAAAPAHLRPIPSPSHLAPCPRVSRPPLMARFLYCS
jgi:hypothetical protein